MIRSKYNNLIIRRFQWGYSGGVTQGVIPEGSFGGGHSQGFIQEGVTQKGVIQVRSFRSELFIGSHSGGGHSERVIQGGNWMHVLP